MDQLNRRGGTEEEVVEAIRDDPWRPAELGRLECRRSSPFNSTWNGHWYATKRIRPIFVDNPDRLVVVTVYVYYF